MDAFPDRRITNMEGDAALPRKNGELVFEAPWEGRAFGLAVALNESGQYEWTEFSDQLAAEIKAGQGKAHHYYDQWLASLEQLAIAKGLVTLRELDSRTDEYASGERDDD